MKEAATLIYKTEGMISTEVGNYTGIVALYDDRCLFYNEKRLMDTYEFDITHAEIVTGTQDVTFLNMYSKEKEYVQIKCSGKESIRYFLNSNRIDWFVGKFEQRRVEKQNFRIVLKALQLGYTGEHNFEEKTPRDKQLSGNDAKVLVRKPEMIHSWNDLLTPPAWRDYYNTLNTAGKKVYDIILQGIVEYKDTVCVEGIKLSNEAVGVIYHFILWDNPAIFCIGEYAMWRAVAADGKHIKITSLCGDRSNEEPLRREVLAGVLRFLSDTKIYQMSDLQKEKYVHDYMIRNWTYDLTCGNGGARLEPYTIYGTFVQKSAVCEGFAKSAKLLLDILGVHSMVVSGTIKSENAGHAWNVVKVNGLNYHLDITFDMGQTGGKNYAIRYDYFNVPDEDLKDRDWQNREVVWRCDTRDYSYPAIVGGVVDSPEKVCRYIEKELIKHKPYLYIKMADQILNQAKYDVNWLQLQFDFVRKKLNAKAKAVAMNTSIKGLYVIAIHY